MNGLNEKGIWKNGEGDRLSADTVEELIEIVAKLSNSLSYHS